MILIFLETSICFRSKITTSVKGSNGYNNSSNSDKNNKTGFPDGESNPGRRGESAES